MSAAGGEPTITRALVLIRQEPAHPAEEREARWRDIKEGMEVKLRFGFARVVPLDTVLAEIDGGKLMAPRMKLAEDDVVIVRTPAALD